MGGVAIWFVGCGEVIGGLVLRGSVSGIGFGVDIPEILSVSIWSPRDEAELGID